MSQAKELQDILSVLKQGKQPRALATVVEARGSTYRRAGARLLILDDDSMVGGISGGCLEADICARSKEIVADGRPALVTYDHTSDADLVFGLALGCNGVIRVLVEPLPERALPAYLRAVDKSLALRRPMAVALAVGGMGELRHELGECLWIGADGAIGGELALSPHAERIVDDARIAMADGRSELKTYVSDSGELEVFIESIQPPLSLIIFGAGHDSVPLADLAKRLGWQVTVVDGRPAYARRERFPMADDVRLCRAEAVPDEVLLEGVRAAVVMNHHYYHDRSILSHLLRSPVPYIGVLGPRKRTQKMLDELAQEGLSFDDAQLSRLYAPVGLDIGAETPDQVALSIVAEILAVSSDRSGTSLKYREAGIHESLG
ncbi:XdhC family protein [Methylocaldum szegediense]|uniref:Xanthine dehydrogenase accessory factor n=1 Tax=Methylocaldum szegediense TaxID=73780 RepID=A0ABM9I264_9GAMM|nr:XdhC/CoxI family protein [Methylocaldum szegediense]CAI8840412.1 xanthine dehydrogenase accessory factor [Methylocaldum szegediense]